jgi:single-stranded-DNA-specific exonuclease
MALPKPTIVKRILNKKIYDEAKSRGYTHMQALIVANRELPEGTDFEGFMNPDLSKMPNIGLLPDIHKAGERIAEGIINNEVIGLVCDFDVDGISSAAVMYKALVDLFQADPTKIKVFISNRMKEGYGFSHKVLDRILETDPVPTLLITADQGSADGERVTRYLAEMKKRKLKGDVVVSDHHEIPKSGGPADAYAFVNPQIHESRFPDRTICGCTVALFVMAATRHKLIKSGHLKDDGKGIRELIAYSTAATIADCVSMASQTNRAIVTQGLREINLGSLPAWKQMKKFVKDPQELIKAESIAFGLGPKVNACSRTGGDGLNAVKYYLSDNDLDAERYLEYLNSDNDIRKGIEKRLVDEATEVAKRMVDDGYLSLVIFNKNGHHGVHGIAASRLVERFGRPTIMLSPKEVTKEDIGKDKAERLLGMKITKFQDFYDLPNNQFISAEQDKKDITYTLNTITVVSGSARSIDGLGDDQKGMLSILECMIDVQDKFKVFHGFGGHCMAAGMALDYENIGLLRKGIEEAVREHVNPKHVYPKVLTDGYLPAGTKINLDLVDEIGKLEPYGRQFDYPSFTVEAKVIDVTVTGANKDTGMFEIEINGYKHKAVWFKYSLSPMFNTFAKQQTYKMVIEIKDRWYEGRRYIQMMIKHGEPM